MKSLFLKELILIWRYSWSRLYTRRKTKVKNLLIKNNKIYVSYQKSRNECFTNEILVSDLKFEKIIFDEFLILMNANLLILKQVVIYQNIKIIKF